MQLCSQSKLTFLLSGQAGGRGRERENHNAFSPLPQHLCFQFSELYLNLRTFLKFHIELNMHWCLGRYFLTSSKMGVSSFFVWSICSLLSIKWALAKVSEEANWLLLENIISNWSFNISLRDCLLSALTSWASMCFILKECLLTFM